MDQDEISGRNRIARNAAAYDAWVRRYGTPDEAGTEIRKEPEHALRRILPHLGNPRGLKIANPLGSHGRVGTALAVLGAEVTVFDISPSNARYAHELSAAAGVDLDVVVGDFVEQAQRFAGAFDAAVMELGIVHYFLSIERFMASLRSMVTSSGAVVLIDFHPILKKAVSIEEAGISLAGDYFSTVVETSPAPYAAFLDDEVPDCLVRRWTLGEIVTGFVESGFRLTRLEEHPSWDCDRLPGTFTLVGSAA